ncbi:MAG: TonB-dependent receptor domain-containing protein [Asticcacaulis sp.]
MINMPAHSAGSNSFKARTSYSVLAACLMALASSQALAQSQAAAPTGQKVQEVTVTADRPVIQNRIDRKVYNVERDLQSTTGTLSDALNKVPSVNVDIEGNVSLRGEGSVTILVDGKPSAQFSGATRADAIQALGVEQIEQIEVITNPSAAFRPDGAGGIINIVTKKNRQKKSSTTVRLNYGDEGRSVATVSGSWTDKGLNLYGSLGYRHGRRSFESDTDRTRIDPVTKQESRSLQSSDASGKRDIYTYQLGVDYNLTPEAKVGLSVNGNTRKGPGSSFETNQFFDNSRTLIRNYTRSVTSDGDNESLGLAAYYEYTFKRPGEKLRLDLRRSQSEDMEDRLYLTRNLLPVSPNSAQRLLEQREDESLNASFDYTRPMDNDRLLDVGLDFEVQDNLYDYRVSDRNLLNGQDTIDTRLTNVFEYEQRTQAAYATYQWKAGDWTFLPGARYESTRIRTNQRTTGQRTSDTYEYLHPSLAIGYTLSDTQKLRASYSHRVRRPGNRELNPFPWNLDAQRISTGNPFLKPQETDSFELGYEHVVGRTFYNLTAYARKNTNSITSLSSFNADGVLVTKPVNTGKSNAGGLEFVVNGRLSPKLTYNVNGGLGYYEINARNLGINKVRKGVQPTVRTSFDYKPTDKDTIQLSGFYMGERKTADGKTKSMTNVNIGYRHQVDSTFAIVFTGSDIFNGSRWSSTIDTPELKEDAERKFRGRSFFIGITKTFGAEPRRRPGQNGFEFERPETD